MNPPSNATLDSALAELFRKKIRTILILDVAASVFFGVAGLGCLIAGLAMDLKPDPRLMLLYGGAGLLAAGIGGVWFYRRKHFDLVSALERTPNSVVWVFQQTNNARVSGIKIASFDFVTFCLENGRRAQIRLATKDVQSTLGHLRDVLPHATFGYSRARERAYALDPSTPPGEAAAAA